MIGSDVGRGRRSGRTACGPATVCVVSALVSLFTLGPAAAQPAWPPSLRSIPGLDAIDAIGFGGPGPAASGMPSSATGPSDLPVRLVRSSVRPIRTQTPALTLPTWFGRVRETGLPVRGAGGRHPGETGVWLAATAARTPATLVPPALAVLDREAPAGIDRLTLHLEPDGPAGGIAFTVPRQEVTAWREGRGSPAEIWRAATLAAADPQEPPTGWLGDAPIRAAVEILTQVEGPLRSGPGGQRRVYMAVSLHHALASSVAQVATLRLEGGSRLTVPADALADPSRTGLATGLIAARPVGIDRWTLARTGRLPAPLPDRPARLTAGWLDDRTAGLIAETLARRRVDDRWLTDLQLGAVVPRDPWTSTGVLPGVVMIGRAVLRWEGPQDGMDWSAELGRYLDGDGGGAVSAAHRLPTGWQITARAWATVRRGDPEAGLAIGIGVPLARALEGRVRVGWRAAVAPLTIERARWPAVPDLYTEGRGARLTDLMAGWSRAWDG